MNKLLISDFSCKHGICDFVSSLQQQCSEQKAETAQPNMIKKHCARNLMKQGLKV